MAHVYAGLCREIDRLREGLRLPLDRASHARLADVCARQRGSPVLDCFIEEARRGIDGEMRMDETRAVVARAAPTELLIGFFDRDAYDCMSLECAAVEPYPRHPHFASAYATDIFNPVRVHDCTQGLRHPHMIALFPEHWLASEPTREHYRAFNFMDRFVARFFRITLPAIQAGVRPGDLALLRGATEGRICSAAIVWIQLHEYFHTTGFLPLIENFGLKSSRSMAGLEECRVDALAALACFEEAQNGVPDAEMYAQFVLAERLLRYPLQAPPGENYDARGSQFLLGFLDAIGAVSTDGARLAFDQTELQRGLRAFIGLVEANERVLSACRDRRGLARHTRRFVDLFSGYDAASRSCPRLPLYEHVLDAFRREGRPTVMDYGLREPRRDVEHSTVPP